MKAKSILIMLFLLVVAGLKAQTYYYVDLEGTNNVPCVYVIHFLSANKICAEYVDAPEFKKNVESNRAYYEKARYSKYAGADPRLWESKIYVCEYKRTSYDNTYNVYSYIATSQGMFTSFSNETYYCDISKDRKYMKQYARMNIAMSLSEILKNIKPRKPVFVPSGGYSTEYQGSGSSSSSSSSSASSSSSSGHSNQGKSPCRLCKGKGQCYECHGTGSVTIIFTNAVTTCGTCHGDGICRSCNGTGHYNW